MNIENGVLRLKIPEPETISCTVPPMPTLTITGTPPFTFGSSGGNLIDYIIYGAEGGVGDYDSETQKYVIPIRVKGKNLFDKSNYDLQALVPIAQSMTIKASADAGSANARSLIVAVSPNTTYTFSMFHLASQLGRDRMRIGGCESYPEAGATLTSIDDTMTRKGNFVYNTFTTGENTNYALIFLWAGSAYTEAVIQGIIENNKLQLETGDIMSVYVPYFDETIIISTNVPIQPDDSLSMSQTGINIPTNVGRNKLTVGTTVQPSSMTIKYK